MQQFSKFADTLPDDDTCTVLDFDFDATQALIASAFAAIPPNAVVYHTEFDAGQTYINAFHGAEVKQYHNCDHCLRFINRYGTLVVVSESGVTPVLAATAGKMPGVYADVFAALTRAAASAPLGNVFCEALPMLGTPSNVAGNGSPREGETFTHFHARNPQPWVSKTQTDNQRRAEVGEFTKMLHNALTVDTSLLKTAVTLLQSDSTIDTKFAAQVEAHINWRGTLRNGAKRSVLVAHKAAKCDPAFPRLMSSAVGSMLRDLVKGVSAKEALAGFKNVTSAANYMVAKAPVKAGAIRRAEELIEKLGLQAALNRRYATLADFASAWTSTGAAMGTPEHPAAPAPKPGVFAAVAQAAIPASPVSVVPGARRITMSRFIDTILRTAERIDVHLAPEMTLGAFVTEAEPGSGNLFQWDSPLSWYFWTAQSPANFGLTGATARVLAVANLPGGRDGYNFVLEGAREGSPQVVGSAIMPQLLSAELREARHVIQKHSVLHPMQVPAEHAAGVIIRPHTCNLTLSVTANGLLVTYYIDQWN